MRGIAKKLYYLIIYYFSFFYALYILNIGNQTLISGMKEILIFLLIFVVAYEWGNEQGGAYFLKGTIIVGGLYGVVLLYSAFRATTASYIFIDLKYYLIWPLMIIASKHIIRTYEDYKQLVFHINICCVIIGFIGLYGYVQQVSELTQWRTTFQVYAPKSIVSTSFDFGALMGLAAFVNLTMLFYENKKLMRIILVVFYSVMTFLSYTRGSYVSLILFVYLMIRKGLADKLNSRRGIKVILDIIVVALCIYVYVAYSDAELLSNQSLLDRVYSVWPTIQSSASLFGSGLGTVGRSVNGVSVYSVSDNSFLRIIVTLGFVGLALILIIFYRLYHTSRSKSFMGILYIAVGVTAFFSDYIVFTPAALMVYCLIGAFCNLEEDDSCYLIREDENDSGY